jgi:hypothetical protein
MSNSTLTFIGAAGLGSLVAMGAKRSHWTDDVPQFCPIAPAMYRQLLVSKSMLPFLNRVMASRSVREQRVRSEAGRVLLMARELEKLLAYEA